MNKIYWSILIIVITFGIISIFIATDPNDLINPINTLQAPSIEHFFGTDTLGRDTLQLILMGLKYSLLVASSCSIISLVIGFGVALINLSKSNLLKSVVSTVSDIIIVFPTILISFILWAVMGSNLLTIIIAISIGLSFKTFRVFSTEVQLISKSQYWSSSTAIGSNTLFRVLHHLLPNIRKTLLIQVSISFGIALSAEAGLSFLGMAGSDTITLGTILSEGIKYLRLSPALALIPGLIITLLIWTTAKLADTHPSNQT